MSNKTNPYAFLEVNSDVEEELQTTTTTATKVQTEKPEKRDRKPSNELLKIYKLKKSIYRG